jgi:hypothetical protein
MGAAWVWPGMCEFNIDRPETAWGRPAPASSDYHVEFHEGCYENRTIPLNCRNRSSNISGYQADFHAGHGTVGEWQGRGMARQGNGMGTA